MRGSDAEGMDEGASMFVLTESDRVEIRLSGLVKPTTDAKPVRNFTPPHKIERAGSYGNDEKFGNTQ